MNPHVRWMIRRDAAEVMAIEIASFTDPWSENFLDQTLQQRDHIARVAEVGDTVVGYVVYQLCDRHLEAQRLAVAPAWRRRGVGRALLAKLCSKLPSHRRNRIAFNVSDDNLAAHLWLRAAGFEAVRVEGDEYRFVWRTTETYEEHLAELLEESA